MTQPICPWQCRLTSRRPHSAAINFRDMYSIVGELAKSDTTIVQRRPNSTTPLAIDHCLDASKEGDKQNFQDTFSRTLTVCAAVSTSLSKYRAALTTRMRDEFGRLCITSVGIELFTSTMAYDMSLSVYYTVSSSSERVSLF